MQEEVLEAVLSQLSYAEFKTTLVGLPQKFNEEAKLTMKQLVIDESEPQSYVDQGWHFVSTFNRHHAKVEIDSKKLPNRAKE